MIDFLRDNLGTIIIALILALIVAAIIRKLILDRRQGKSQCSFGCEGCPSASICHSDKQKINSKQH